MKFGKLILAPLAGVTDLPFRLICREEGAKHAYTEMISAETLCRINKAKENLTKTTKEDSPLSVQIFGSKPERMAMAAKAAEPIADVIDINLGCPAPKIACQEAGAGALANLETVREMISAVIDAVDIPVTVKTRTGMGKCPTVFDVLDICQDEGVAALCVHGRSLNQMYTGHADWELISKVHKRAKIPIIGNGDIVDEKSAKEALKRSDSIMIGRGAIGDPGIFRRISHFLKTGKKISTDTDYFERYVEYCKDFGMYELERIRPQMMWFSKNMPGSRPFRAKVGRLRDVDSVIEAYRRFVREKSEGP